MFEANVLTRALASFSGRSNHRRVVCDIIGNLQKRMLQKLPSIYIGVEVVERRWKWTIWILMHMLILIIVWRVIDTLCVPNDFIDGFLDGVNSERQ
ncbi:hypothetical protein AMD01_05940 [Priestia koreensis]|uniref:Uncharacterized protein n=1 Tax=Priestia koreensis TaxID=284581 RepID=A0A0M0L977_9BACI|nr:hypothetical protein AMD01_05940 [Priestia koreensis]